MKHKGLNQTDLADKLGTSQSAISGWLGGRKLPEGKLMVRLPEILAVSGHWLLTGQGSIALPGKSANAEDSIGRVEVMAEVLELSKLMFDAVQRLYGKILPATSAGRDEAAEAQLEGTVNLPELAPPGTRPRRQPKGKAPRRRAAGD